MNSTAGYCNRCRKLLALSKEIPEEQFIRLVGQHPGTMERDVEWAEQDFQRARLEYENHCASTGQTAYYTYNED